MHRYVVKRLLMMIPVLLGITILVFLMLHLTPGDPARSMLGDTASPAEIEALREELGLNDNLIVQYLRYMKNLVFHGSLGTSYVSGREVMSEILNRFPTTILLALCGIFVTVLIGVPTGIIAAVKQNSWMDKVATFIGLFGVSMPAILAGIATGTVLFSEAWVASGYRILRAKVLDSSGIYRWPKYISYGNANDEINDAGDYSTGLYSNGQSKGGKGENSCCASCAQ